MAPERGGASIVLSLINRPPSQSKPTPAGAVRPHHANKPPSLMNWAERPDGNAPVVPNFQSSASIHLKNPPPRTVLSSPFHLAKDSGAETDAQLQACIPHSWAQ